MRSVFNNYSYAINNIVFLYTMPSRNGIGCLCNMSPDVSSIILSGSCYWLLVFYQLYIILECFTPTTTILLLLFIFLLFYCYCCCFRHHHHNQHPLPTSKHLQPFQINHLANQFLYNFKQYVNEELLQCANNRIYNH